MSNIPLRAGTLSRFCIESLKSANSVGNINTAEPQQKKKKECDSRRKGLLPLGTGGCLDYTYIYTIYFLFGINWKKEGSRIFFPLGGRGGAAPSVA